MAPRAPGRPMAPIALAHDDLGEGAPWVLLHGFPLTRRLWDAQRPLAARARLVLPDLRGFGASPAAAPATMDTMAEDVLALADDLGLGRFGLLGLSMGGYVALALHRRAPGRVAALALVDTQAGADTEEGRARREELARRIEAEGAAVLVRDFLPKLLGPRGRDDADLVARARALVLASGAPGLAAAMRGMAAREDLRPHLADIRCPTLVVVGEHDEVTPPAKARELAAGIAGARFVTLPGAGHLSNLEAPAAFNETLGAFVIEQRVREQFRPLSGVRLS